MMLPDGWPFNLTFALEGMEFPGSYRIEANSSARNNTPFPPFPRNLACHLHLPSHQVHPIKAEHFCTLEYNSALYSTFILSLDFIVLLGGFRHIKPAKSTLISAQPF